MVKQKKTDRDKWYYAAKEQGYRSRAAFKLIQINKKFNFLSSARACLDLCAAPGGWLQVAAKYMPVSSIIIGVDLLPIKPIRNVTLLKEDITTQKCRHEIKKNLKGWKVDVCLHDGAPNLGLAWAHDAYGQSTLTLAAVGLAVDFLREGGTFVTKVFRSSDYNSLLWVFNQLFKKVTATKPPSSRNTSAEIFVICEGFLAPKQLDPRFLDPKHVFKELDAPAEKDLYFGQKRSKRNREGYEDGAQLLFKKATALEFIESENPTVILANVHCLEFDKKSKKFLDDRLTNDEVQAFCEDIQVLGKAEMKTLLRWRLQMRKKHSIHAEEENLSKDDQNEQDDQNDESGPPSKEDEEHLLDKELESRLTKAQLKMKKKLKKERKKQRKLQHRIDLKMDLIGDHFDQEQDESLFGLASIRNKEQLKNLQTDDEKADIIESDEEDVEMDEQLDPEDEFLSAEDRYAESLESTLEEQYQDFLEKRKKVQRSITIQKNTTHANPLDNKLAELEQKINAASQRSIYDSDDSDQELDAPDDDSNPLMVRDKSADLSVSKRASLWFSQNLFSDMDSEVPSALDQDDDDDQDDEQDEPEIEIPQKNTPIRDSSEKSSVSIGTSGSASSVVEDSSDSVPEDWKTKEVPADEEEGFEVVPMNTGDSDSDMDDYEKAELLAMGTLIKSGKMTLSDLIDDGFNRYAFNDEGGLPVWFEDEERPHSVPNLPITREMVREIQAQNKALNSRPVKKVAEAKARKKVRATRKLDKIKQKANVIAEDGDLSEVAKARAIEKLYKSQIAKMETKRVYVVRGKGNKGKGRIGPKSTGGTRVKVVDKRMKADKRGEKFAARRKKK